MTFMMTQQRTCIPKLIAIFARLQKFKGPIRLQGCMTLYIFWIRETVQIEVIIVRPNFHMNICEQFTIREHETFFRRVSKDGSILKDVDEDGYLRGFYLH